MKCQKCQKTSVVHLTEVVSDPAGGKKSVEVHLCMGHAVEAGLVAAPPTLGGHMNSELGQAIAEITAAAEGVMPTEADTGLPMAIVPNPPAAGGLVPTRQKTAEPAACPHCGLTWNVFKQTGLMGCTHDYEVFESKLMPLLKRAQEGASQHVGKVPVARGQPAAEKQVVTLRLRRELQKAIDAENYEQAARLRDELRQWGE